MTDMNSLPAYGLWGLVIINSLIFIIFAFSFTKPRNARDWRSFGAFSAFIVALFTEMYGYLFPRCRTSVGDITGMEGRSALESDSHFE